jgi:hypothetical protein
MKLRILDKTFFNGLFPKMTDYSVLIKEQNDKLRQLRAAKADPAIVDAEVRKLKELMLNKNESAPILDKSAFAGKKIQIKTPKVRIFINSE